MTTSIKTCFKCNIEKPLSEFYKHAQMADGHLNKCKDCARKDASTNRKARIEYYRAYDRKRGSRKTLDDLRRYRSKNAIKYAAHLKVNNAVRAGKLKKEPCEVCGDTHVHAHHDDYAKPLVVRWLCPAHHQEWHSEHGEAKNAG